MKLIAFLVLVVSAVAYPTAIVLPRAETESRSAGWVRANPSGQVLTMTSRADCGSGLSMKPVLESGDRMAFEANVGQRFKGEILLVRVAYCKLPIAHFCYDETATHVFLTGLNNRKSDGWVPKSQVCGVLVGVLRPE